MFEASSAIKFLCSGDKIPRMTSQLLIGPHYQFGVCVYFVVVARKQISKFRKTETFIMVFYNIVS